MKKIISFFDFLGEKTLAVFDWAKHFIFRKAEEEKKRKLQKGIITGVGLALLIIAVAALAWWGYSRFFVKTSDVPTIAEAKVYIVTSDKCGQKCWDVSLFLDALEQKGVKIVRQQRAYVSWLPFAFGNVLAKKYAITKVPTILVEFVGKDQPDINNFFNADLGRVIDDKFVLDKILAPYYDLSDKRLKGVIEVTYLTDKSCTECYDVNRHEIALKNLGINIEGKIVDIETQAGQDLINKYKITKVPTVLVSGEVGEYQVLAQAWADVGRVTDDGTYIFTNVDLMGDSYKDLTTGKIIEAKPDVSGSAAVK